MTSYTHERMAAPRRPSSNWSSGTWMASLQAHRTLYSLALLTYGASVLQSLWLGIPLKFSASAFISTTTALMVLIIVLCRLMVEHLRLWRQGAPGSPAKALLRKLFNDILTPRRVSNGFHALLATGIFTAGFTTIKSNIPRAAPFAWDETLMKTDRLLHFGMLPHELLSPLYHSHLAIFIVNFIYNVWFVILLSFFIWQGLCENDSALRQRYLLSYVLSWGAGTLVLGTIFSSGGPCFYGVLVPGPNPYAELMQQLSEASEDYRIWALSAQHLLWAIYENSGGTVSGISAMPSMHVASSVLFLLCARAAKVPWLTWLCGFVAVAIFVGSIVLGWHYAADGYAGVLVALICWKAAGWWVARSPVSSRPS